jgi:hypothetical protein
MAFAKGEWLEALSDLPELFVDRGIAHARKEGGEFPPSIPQFRSWCIPDDEELGVESELEAYKKYINQNYSGIVRAVSFHLSSYDMRMASVKEARRMFKEAYQLVLPEYRAQCKQQLFLEHQN